MASFKIATFYGAKILSLMAMKVPYSSFTKYVLSRRAIPANPVEYVIALYIVLSVNPTL